MYVALNLQLVLMSLKKDFAYNDKLSFVAEWHHQENIIILTLNFYPIDGTLELLDPHGHKCFLKRTKIKNIELKDVYPCTTLVIFGRMIRVVDYMNCFTQSFIGSTQERALIIIKPLVKYQQYGEIISVMERHFRIANIKRIMLNEEYAFELYSGPSFSNDKNTAFLRNHIASGPIVVLELVSENAIQNGLKLLGPSDPVIGRKEAPNSLRAIYGYERVTNAFHLSTTPEEINREITLLLRNRSAPITAEIGNNTICLIKPHVVRNKMLGEIMTYICKRNFTITMIQIFYLERNEAEEFLEVYRSVVENFDRLVDSLLCGPCVGLEIGTMDPNVPAQPTFREVCGPHDPDIARQIRPGTIRAQFGVDKFNNAVHCTDLAEDAAIDLEYFFKILQ